MKFDLAKTHRIMVEGEHKWNVGGGVMRIPTASELARVAVEMARTVAVEENRHGMFRGGLIAKWNGEESVIEWHEREAE
jgi:hypothetical protein